MSPAANNSKRFSKARELVTEHRLMAGVVISSLVGIVLLIVALVFINTINETVETQTFDNVAEIADHDTNLIEYNLDTRWTELQHIADKLEADNPDTILGIQEFLNTECAASDFKALYIVDSDGQLYTDAYRNLTTKMNEIKVLMEQGDGRFVVRDNTEHTFRELRQELITYGIQLPDDYRDMAGKHFVCMMGINDIAELSDYLRISNYNGQGWSSLVAENGEYIINESNGGALSDVDNLFTELRDGQAVSGGMSIDEIISNIENKQSFQFTWISPDGNTIASLVRPLENTGWSFITFVPQSVFYDQSLRLISMTVAVVVGVLISMMVLFIFVYIISMHSFHSEVVAQTRSEFLSNMSHEIRTPITGLVGLNYLMEKDIDDKQKMKELLSQSQTTTQYLLSLINDILDLSKLESGKYDVIMEPFSLDSVVSTCWNMQKDIYDERGVELIVEQDIPYPHVLGDETHLKQVLMNILGNASKFTPAGGTVRFTTTQKKDPNSNIVNTTFVIADTGIGMSSEFQEHIFESFSQERNKIKSSQKGTGLGMAISHMLTERMGGTIKVESELGKGSTFTVNLPLQITTEYVEEVPIAEEVSSDEVASELHPGEPLHILLAEDNALNASILIDILEDEGIVVDHASDGAEVVTMFAASEPFSYDLILMDVVMPEQNGYEATKQIRKLPRPDAKTVLIYACTANNYKEDREKAAEAGMNDFLAKPIDVNEMLQLLKLEATKIRKG